MAHPKQVRDTCIFRLVAWDFKRFGMYLRRIFTIVDSSQLLIMIIMPLNSSFKMDYNNYDNLFTLVPLQ